MLDLSAKWVSFVIVFSTIGFSSSADATEPSVYTEFAANEFGLRSTSFLYGQDKQGSSKLEDWKQLQCSGWDDPGCVVYDNLFADLILSPCINESDRACLDGLEAKNSSGVRRSYRFTAKPSHKRLPDINSKVART
jgi:hypothetical protein